MLLIIITVPAAVFGLIQDFISRSYKVPALKKKKYFLKK